MLIVQVVSVTNSYTFLQSDSIGWNDSEAMMSCSAHSTPEHRPSSESRAPVTTAIGQKQSLIINFERASGSTPDLRNRPIGLRFLYEESSFCILLNFAWYKR